MSERRRGTRERIVGPRRPGHVVGRPLNFTVMRLSAATLAFLVCACVSGSKGDSAPFDSCFDTGDKARAVWTYLRTPPSEAPILRKLRDERYPDFWHVSGLHEYWFSASDRRVFLCRVARNPPLETYVFTPSTAGWSITPSELVICTDGCR